MLGDLESKIPIHAIPELFPSAQVYLANSVMAMITFHSLPVLQVLRTLQSEAELEFAMLLLLERSSVHDWKLRLAYLQSLVNSVLTNEPYQKNVSETAKAFAHSFGALFNSQLMERLKKMMNDVKSTQFGEWLRARK